MIRLILAASVVMLGVRQAPPEFDDLEPGDDVFSWVAPPDPYVRVLRVSLVGEHRYRECQVVAQPSFDREWAVYLLREEDAAPRIVFKRMRDPLYSAMMDVLCDGGTKTEYSDGPEERAVALSTLRIHVATFAAPISDDAAEILDQVWSRMLGRVRYPAQLMGGFDGTTYHVSHWNSETGFRSGTTWSPEANTRTAALIHLAEEMRDLAEAVPTARASMETALVADARTLLTRLDRLAEAESPR
ncbi:MAG TPA: hypothetical protein VGR31_14960 [Planctomycetota bacterium]|jgi:hypothetical protein|nr:hypothetical protein [Planctomycetota bacterium]